MDVVLLLALLPLVVIDLAHFFHLGPVARDDELPWLGIRSRGGPARRRQNHLQLLVRDLAALVDAYAATLADDLQEIFAVHEIPLCRCEAKKKRLPKEPLFPRFSLVALDFCLLYSLDWRDAGHRPSFPHS